MKMPTRERTVLPRVFQTVEDIRVSVFGYVGPVQDSLAARGYLPARPNLNKGVVHGLLKVFCWGYWQIYSLLERLFTQATSPSATGTWLDMHAASVDLPRRAATKARGNVRFLRAAQGNSEANVTVPIRRIMHTMPDGAGRIYRYGTQAVTVLPIGMDFTDVPVEAEDYGVAANASVGQIYELVTPVTDISGVASPVGRLVEEGADGETDAQLWERYALQWQASNDCTKYACMTWTLPVPGAASVSIPDHHPCGRGTVDIMVRDADALSTAVLLDRVRVAITPNAPINDD